MPMTLHRSASPGHLRIVGRGLCASLLVTLAACGGSETSTPLVAPPAVATVGITLSASSLFVGQTAQTVVAVKDANGASLSRSVEYASSAPSVASISATGLVTALAPGTTTISATSGGKTATATLTVSLVPVAAIAVTPTRTTILTGDTLQIIAAIRDSVGGAASGYSVAWSTSDPTVASVTADGRVVPLRAGKVTVRATAGGKSGESTLDIAIGRGQRVAELAVLDSVIPALLDLHKIPGASLAVVKDGRLVLARGYGWSDSAAHQPVDPTSIFRLASLSKPLTSAAVMKLVEDGRLSLDDKLFSILSDLQPPPGVTPDPRLAGMTIRHALSHSLGWDRGTTFPLDDPLGPEGKAAAQLLGDTLPASPRTIARYWMGKRLAFSPGTDYAYANVGYVYLQLVIEKIIGMSYENYVRTAILTPSGATGLRLGNTAESLRKAGEVRYYYDFTAPSNIGPGVVPMPYGYLPIESAPGAAGWIGTAPQYLKFITAIDGEPTRPDVLKSATLAQIAAKPLSIWDPYTTYYALGWFVNSSGAQPFMYHGGDLLGTTNWVRRMDNGVSWVLLTNGLGGNKDPVFSSMNNAVAGVIRTVASWPSHDFFSRY
jgi:N-acyl-D-amino-acid deacylase